MPCGLNFGDVTTLMKVFDTFMSASECWEITFKQALIHQDLGFDSNVAEDSLLSCWYVISNMWKERISYDCLTSKMEAIQSFETL